jgi:hypothetical protein
MPAVEIAFGETPHLASVRAQPIDHGCCRALIGRRSGT